MNRMVGVVSKASLYMYMCIYNILYKYVICVICNLHYIYNYLKIGIYQHTIVYIQIYIYVCIYKYIGIYMNIYIYIYIYICINIYIYIYTHMYIYNIIEHIYIII